MKAERHGLPASRVIPVSPVAVEYSITTLGRTLQGPLTELYEWAVSHRLGIEQAKEAFGARKAARVDLV